MTATRVLVTGGAGFIGSAVGDRFAEAGYRVLGFDVNPEAVAKIQAGDSYIDAVPSEVLGRLREAGLIEATTEIARVAEVDAIADRLRVDPGFPPAGQGLGAVGGDQRHRVFRPAHDAGIGAHIVGHDPVTALARALGGGIGDHVVGLGGKAHHQSRPPVAALRHPGQDVGVFGKL